MSDAITRLLALTITGQSDLQPVSFHAEEAISAPFEVTVDFLSKNSAIAPNSLLYKPACLTVTQDPTSRFRYFNGLIRAVSMNSRSDRGWYRYSIVIVPKLWFMSQTTDCRVFQAKSVADILTTICGENGQTLKLSIYGDKTALEYVTQYNETDLDFIGRLMEQAGYFYFFTHTTSDHVMTVTDKNQAFPTSPKPTMTLSYEGNNWDVLSEWRGTSATAAGKVTLMDYDPSQASPLTANQSTTFTTGGVSSRDINRWPALSFVAGDITARSKIDIEAAEAEVSLFDTAGTNCALGPGSPFSLKNPPWSYFTGYTDYVVRAAVHDGVDETWLNASGRASYSNRLSVFSSSLTWRQKLTIPRPVMAGIYAAIVLGDSGEEIHADSLARVKVQLLWEYRKETVADQAIWVRVIQPFAGNSWGFQHLPRVGTEVAVAFMDGDPDRPVIVGGVYNASNSPIFPVPSQQNKSGFRSRSTTQGTTANFSELSFDDTKGSELVFFHAEKDMTREVENDDTITVMNGNRSITVSKGNHTTTISQGNFSTTVSQGKHETTVSTSDHITTVSQGKMTTTVSTGNHETTVSTGDMKTTVSTGNHTTTVSTGNFSNTVSTGNHSTTVSLGNFSVSCDAGAVSIEAMQSITLKVGGNSVTIDQTGVTVKGIMVTVQGNAMLSLKAPMTQVNGDGMVMVKGGIVMIN